MKEDLESKYIVLIYLNRVLLAKHKETDQTCALKLMKRKEGPDDRKESIMNEVNVMRKLNHKNIVNLIDFNEEAEFVKKSGKSRPVYSIALELAEGGELFDFIAETGNFSEEVARYFFHQLCDAFEYLHGEGISHRDIKPENILLDSKFNLKLADFGLSTFKNMTDSVKGTLNYMAPEIILGERYSGKAVDLFAAGIILFVMVSRHPPFMSASHQDKKYLYIGGNRPNKFWKNHSKTKPNGTDFYSPELRDLVTSLLSFYATERPSLAEVKASEWYNGPVPTYDEIVEEFTKRKAMLAADNIQDDSTAPSSEAEEEIFARRDIHRSEGGELDEAKLEEEVERTCEQYVPELKRYTQFFSKSDLSSLFHTLAIFVDKTATEYGFSAEEYSCTFKVIKEEVNLSVTVNILEAGDELYCVEAIKNKGDRFEFTKIYKDMKEYFGGHLNASEPCTE